MCKFEYSASQFLFFLLFETLGLLLFTSLGIAAIALTPNVVAAAIISGDTIKRGTITAVVAPSSVYERVFALRRAQIKPDSGQHVGSALVQVRYISCLLSNRASSCRRLTSLGGTSGYTTLTQLGRAAFPEQHACNRDAPQACKYSRANCSGDVIGSLCIYKDTCGTYLMLLTEGTDIHMSRWLVYGQVASQLGQVDTTIQRVCNHQLFAPTSAPSDRSPV
jgi:hypothetical protein